MSPAVVALARAFSSESDTEPTTTTTISATDNHDVQPLISKSTDFYDQVDSPLHATAKSKSRSSSFSDLKHRQSSSSSPLSQLLYHYDPYHQYCRTGSDYYKSYHLSYQAYSNGGRYDPLLVGPRRPADAIQPPPQAAGTKLAAARARAARLRRRLADLRTRTSSRIQKLALVTISVMILTFIFTRTIFPSKIPGFISPTQLRRGVISYSKSLVFGYADLADDISNPSGFSENGSIFGVVPKSEPVLENLFVSPTSGAEDLPTIARHVFLKFYALAFLGLLIFVSFICERIFGCKITVKHEDLLDEEEEEEEEEDEDLDELDELDETDAEEDVEDGIGNYVIDDMYWDCQPTSIRVPKLPLAKLGVKSPQVIVTDLKISILYLLPLRTISRVWGWMNGVQLPVSTRQPLYRWYATTFGCNLDEILVEDLQSYRNLGEFFRRTLKPGVRPIGKAQVVSPADGRVVQLEPISMSTGYVGSVKGIHYSIENFLGPNGTPPKLRPGNRLYSCVVYLAPGDYHRFHSPTNWRVQKRRHFSGRLLSVKPSFVAQVPNLFAINERVVYAGEWEHGFFSMTAVGATNVGTVNVYFDPELQTNQFALSQQYRTEKHFPSNGIALEKGELFGEFNLGSTIVLIYEAAESCAEFPDLLDKKIKYGENVHLIN